MGQATLQVRARGLGRDLLPYVALSVWLLSTGPGAAPQNSNPPEVQAHEDEFPFGPKTFVDMTPAELAQAVPELKHVQPAESQDMLPQILQRVGATVAVFFDDFPNTTCNEHVTSMVGTALQTGALHYDNKYNYVALAQAGDEKGLLREYRTDAKGDQVRPVAKNRVVTLGFVTLSMHFHPDYQADSRFRYLGREAMEKQDTYVVAFAQRPAVARQTQSVQFFGQSGIVFLQGVAWIDPASFRILRLDTDIQEPELNVGLLKETTQVLYSEVRFTQGGKTLWLPREVTVRGQLYRYRFNNRHRYSGYRLFTVETKILPTPHDQPLPDRPN